MIEANNRENTGTDIPEHEQEKHDDSAEATEVSTDPLARVHEVIDFMGNKLGAELEEDEYPKILLRANPLGDSSYHETLNLININKKNINDGVHMGEEIGHFWRTQLRPKEDKREHNTNEFFGFLGRRILQNSELGEQFQWNEEEEPTREEVLEFIARRKKWSLEASKKLKENQGDDELTKFYRRKLFRHESERKSMLAHFYGYKFARQVNINRIKNWGKLFSMPNAEVRKRFFQENPDYSGLEEAA